MGEGTFIKQLLESCGSSDTAVAAVASFYHLVLEALPVLAGAGEQGNSTVSALAFGCRILQQLWRSVIVAPFHVISKQPTASDMHEKLHASTKVEMHAYSLRLPSLGFTGLQRVVQPTPG